MPPMTGIARRSLAAAALAAAAHFFAPPASATITAVAAPDSAYSPAVAAVGYWHFDETTGTSAADASGTGNAGVVTCLTALCVSTPTIVSGISGLGDAREFTGLSDSLVRIPDIGAYNFNDSITVSAWVRPSSLSQPSGAGIIVRGNGGAENFALDVSGGFYRFMPKTGTVVVSTNAIEVGRWTHLTGVYDSAGLTAKLYVDGSLAATLGAPASRTAAIHDISVGNRQSAGGSYDRGFLGAIDDPRVQHAALNAAQVLAQYQGSFVATVTAPAPNDGVQIGLAPNAFGAAANISVTIDPFTTPILITPAILNAGLTVLPTGFTLVPNSIIEISPTVAAVPFTQNMGSSASVSIPYLDANGDNVIDGSNPQLAASKLRAYTLNTTVNRWELLESYVDATAKRVIVFTPHFSVFGLFAPSTFGGSLSQTRVYPIPWRPGSGGRFDAPGVTFDRLPTSGTIRILNLAGEYLREFTFDGSAAGSVVWNGTTNTGRRAANGVYFARVTGDDGSTALIKFAVER